MSPPDGDVTVVDPTLRRRVVVAQLHKLASKERALHVAQGHAYVEEASQIAQAVKALESGDAGSVGVWTSLIRWTRETRDTQAAIAKSPHAKSYWAARRDILDEALALLRGIR